MKRIIVGVTGASGSVYAVKLLEMMAGFDAEIHLVFSDTAKEVLEYETGESAESLAARLNSLILEKKSASSLVVHDNKTLSPSIASGSFRTEGMIIIPCSMACAGRIANCSGSRLIERAADVVLKEGRKLCLAVRETPLNRIHLKNLLSLSEAGASVYPASPSFYGKPETIEQLASGFAARILDSFGFAPENYREWGGFIPG